MSVDEIRKMILSLGADVCGFSDIDRFGNAPQGYKPTDIYPACKTVVVFGVALTKGLLQVAPRLVYGHFNHDVVSRVDAIALNAAKKIEEEYQCNVVPIPSDSPYEYWDEVKLEGRGLISMKHAAVNAGLGSIGKNSLFLNRKYGNRLCIGAILIDKALPSDELSEDICLPNCHKCIDACPVHAIQDGSTIQKLCREHTYGITKRGFGTVDCNVCRAICPVRFGR